MMELYTVSPAPVKGNEVVEAVKGLLANGAGKPSALEVYQQRVPSTAGPEFAVVLEPILPRGYTASVSRKKGVLVQVRMEVKRGRVSDPDQYLADAHAWARGVLVGQSPTITGGSAYVPIAPESEPTAAGYDADTDTYYSAAEYLVAVTP